jgi:hypothetical protein
MQATGTAGDDARFAAIRADLLQVSTATACQLLDTLG